MVQPLCPLYPKEHNRECLRGYTPQNPRTDFSYFLQAKPAAQNATAGGQWVRENRKEAGIEWLGFHGPLGRKEVVSEPTRNGSG